LSLLNLIYLQFHSTFGDENCVTSNLESIRLSTIVALVTDIILLSIMLIGLFRMRRHGGGALALGRLLWSQVGHCSNASRQLPCSRLIDIFLFVRVLSGSWLSSSQISRQR
jgi:hypothetical protein